MASLSIQDRGAKRHIVYLELDGLTEGFAPSEALGKKKVSPQKSRSAKHSGLI